MGFAWRGGLKVYKRNALIVLGNDRKEEDFDKIKEILFSLPEDLMKYGLYALMMISPRKATKYLETIDQELETVEWIKEESRNIAVWMRYKFRNMESHERDDWLI